MSAALTVAVWAMRAAAVFITAELITRVWLKTRGRHYVWAPFHKTRMELDRETLPTLEPVVVHEINADGERGDPPPEPGTDLFRVLVVGGSAAECFLLDQRTQWPNVVQEVLRRPENLERLAKARVHVGNISRSLVTCRHLERILEKVLPRYERLDAIVFMTGASDVVHWLEKRAPAEIHEDRIPAAEVFAAHPEPPFGWGPKTLAMRRIASFWRHKLLAPVDQRFKVGKRLGEARRMRARAQEILQETGDPGPMLEHFEHWFRQLLRRAQAKAKLVVVARQPWLERPLTPADQPYLWSFGAGRPYAGEVTAYYAHETAWKLLHAVDERAAAIADELGALAIDLNPLLAPNWQIYYDEMHHTPEGCRIIGEAVARGIVDAVAERRSARGTRAHESAAPR